MKKRMSVCFFIFTMCLFYFSSPNVIFGQSLAEKVFQEHEATILYEEIRPLLPAVLRAFQKTEVQSFLVPADFGVILNNPGVLTAIDPAIDYRFVGLLTLNNELRELFANKQFQTLLQTPSEIVKLTELIEGTPRPTRLEIVSGDNQIGDPNDPLADPFIVEVRDHNDKVLRDIDVDFHLTVGRGRLLPTRPTKTNNLGQAEATLTLGSNPGIYKVEASVEGFPSLTQTFTAAATGVSGGQDESPEPTTLTIVSGNGQQGHIGTQLPSRFVVEVRDQDGEVLPNFGVNFRVTKGSGSFSLTTVHPRTTVTTDRNGRASTFLTLGSKVGENRVVASVANFPSLTQTFTAEAIDADVNDDDVVNIIDLSIVLVLIGHPDRSIDGVDADINGDGVVNYKDLILILSVLEPAAAAPSVHALVKIGISAADLRMLLTQVKALPEATQADPVYQRGIVMLEQLLSILTEAPTVPKQTALLVNYPNPFNPETWIPYQLSEASDVRVSIYAVDGRLIRTLALGHQPAGLYQRKNRAAYWDGRNEFGEPVASGLYFYTLMAGDFTATRKMLIRK